MHGFLNNREIVDRLTYVTANIAIIGNIGFLVFMIEILLSLIIP